MTEVGLVLGGGGAKGAYEIGAWRAICETGLNKYITKYSGSSIGAINSAIIQLMTWQEATDKWLNKNTDKVFITHEISLQEIIKTIQSLRNGRVIEFNGIFNREGLIEFLDIINIDKLEEIKADNFVTVSNVTEIPEDKRITNSVLDWFYNRKTGYTQYINLKNVDKLLINNIMLATSAIPIIYSPVEINGQFFVDGGINDNLPIKPLYGLGMTKIIAISLDRISYYQLKRKFPMCDILLIQPSRNLGGLIDGTLNFYSGKLKYSYRMGYNDAMRAIKKSGFMNLVNVD